MSSPLTLAIIPIGPREELRITRDGRHGSAVVRQRVWFEKNGAWRPGKEGVEIPASAAARLAEALVKGGAA